MSRSSDATALPVRRRYDLEIAETGTVDHPKWTVKDPLTLRYFHLRIHDYFVFQQLDGLITNDELVRRFSTTFAPERISPEQLKQFIQRLWQQGLVTATGYGASSGLFARSEHMVSRERTSLLTNFLAIRFRGVDPDRFLTWFSHYVSWIFSLPCVCLATLLICSAIGLVLTEWETLYRELPNVNSFLNMDRLIWFAAVIAGVKVLHELGHAFACKRFGGECRELGVMLLVFTPCLYCNVSDAWLLKNRWHRMFISAAGIYIELILAAICTFLWWWSMPGVLHSVCLYVMVVSSLNTLLLNGNPLLRYDGYYILTDLVDIPNLRSRSQVLNKYWLNKLFFGKTLPAMPTQRRSQNVFLGLYGIASSLYLWLVLFGILWMFYQIAKPLGLEYLVVSLGTVMVLSRCYSGMIRLTHWIQYLNKQGELNIMRFAGGLLLTAALGWFLMGINISRKVKAPLVIASADSITLVTTAAGQMQTEHPLRVGQQVSEREPLFSLINPEEKRKLVKLQGEVDEQTKKLEHLQIQQSDDTSASSRIPSERAVLADLQAQLTRRQVEAKRLNLSAPRSGILIPVATSTFSQTDAELRQDGTPLDRFNQSAWFDAGTSIAELADLTAREAVLYVDQSEIPFLSTGDRVDFTTTQLSGRVLAGEISEIAGKPVDVLPPNLAVLQLIPVQPDISGINRPVAPIHEVRVAFESREHSPLLIHQTGRAAIVVGEETIGQCIARTLLRTFTFELTN